MALRKGGAAVEATLAFFGVDLVVVVDGPAWIFDWVE